MGSNLYTQTLCIDNAVEVAEDNKVSTHNRQQQVTYSTNLVERMPDITDMLNISPSAAVKMAPFRCATKPQWRFLEDLVSRNGGSMDGPPFLPAIITQGHQWSFAATTREGQKTVLWLPFQFGSTDDVIGVYRTVLGLQQLCRWVGVVFWPWYKKNALGISEEWDCTS
jgi:hypothetical protein